MIKPTSKQNRKATAMKLQCCILTVFGLFVSGLQADEIDELVQARMKELQVPGAALAILRDEKLEKEAYYGLSVVEHNVPVSRETVFRLASVTKAITTIAALKLHEDGKLDLDAPISHYLPSTPDHWRSITVRHLLTQTSGIQRESHVVGQIIGENPQKTVEFLLTFVETEFSQLEPVKRSRLKHVPGEAWDYQDHHFTVVGKIVHSISGVTLREYVRNEIFLPLDMKSATFREPKTIIPHLATCYAVESGRLIKPAPYETDKFPEIPGGYGMYCTLHDLVKLERALQEGRFLKPATRDLMWKHVKTESGQAVPVRWFDGQNDTGYGMGWFLHGTKEHPYAFVTGISGTVWVRLPKDGITIIWLSNLKISGHDIGRRDIVNLLVPELKGHTF